MANDPLASAMEFTGERFIPEGTETEITLEHVHRYLMAAELCVGAVVLDAACGAGYGTALLGAKALRAWGVDIDPQAVAHAEENYGGETVSFKAASVLALPFEDQTFDVIVSFETLEHLPEHDEMLREFRRVLKPGGTLVISTPDKPVYNASLAEPNAYHVRELTRAEFEVFLRARFKAVEFYGQRVAFGSLVLSEHGAGALRSVRRLQSGLISADAYVASMYMIAVCSDGPLRPLPVGIYEGAIPQNAMSSLLGGIADRDQQVQDWRNRALDAESEFIQTVRALPAVLQALAERRESDQKSMLGLAHAAAYAQSHRFDLRQLLGDIFVAGRRRRLRPLQTLQMVQDIRLIRASGLIDPEFYAPQKARTLIPAFEDARHYVLVGRELDPNRLFSGAAYLNLNPDLSGGEISPLVHFLRHGHAENRPIGLPSHLLGAEAEDRPRHDWPAAMGHPAGSLHTLRPDDGVLAEGEAGRAFLTKYDLLGSNPEFAGAVEDLKQMTPASAIAGPNDPRPVVSIIVPVYGQLSYTLNCLHSLLGHQSRVSFEILIGDDASPDESERFLSQIPFIRHVRHPNNLGFVDNCNTTATQARGDYIVLLNNDTRVVSGWLDELIESFSLFPKAGLVGSKLFYDDGALQEAGGIFWRDGSAWNYGREDDPNRPRYCHARQVDYVSGASIAIPTALWIALEGFDEIYRPAYAEDADLAFRIRAMGLQTWMQPQSRVIHYEGRTSGTDLTQGVKAYQVANMVTLANRWAEQLSTHRPNGEAPMLERERDLKKRVLVIDATTPTPNEDAGSVLTVTHMQLYQELGYKVYFIPLHNFLYQRKSTDALHRMGVECAYFPYECSLEQFLRRYGRYLDLVQVFRVGVAEAALEALRRYAPQAPVIFHNVDMHYLRMERQAALQADPAMMDAAKAMKVRELALINEVDCTIVLSDVEEGILKVETPAAEVVVFPYMTPVMGTTVGFAERRDIMFLGGYRHPPNVDSALFLANEVWPLIRPQLPHARLLLIGAQAPDEVKAVAAEDIIVAGQVEDLRPCFDSSRVFAAAIRYGAGIKGKVATAMSYGVPVVATRVAAEGMYLVDGRDVRIADGPEHIARAIVELYLDPSEWNRFSTNGLTFVAKNNSMDMGRRVLTEIVHRAALRHARRAIESQHVREILAVDA